MSDCTCDPGDDYMGSSYNSRNCPKHGASMRSADRATVAPAATSAAQRRPSLGDALAGAVVASTGSIKRVNIDLTVEAFPESAADAAFLDVLRLLRPLSPDQRRAVLRAVEAYFNA